MTDGLKEALAWYDQQANKMRDGLPVIWGENATVIVAAARNWEALTTAGRATNRFTVTCCEGQHEVRLAGELVAWCRFHRAAGDADKDCWGAGLDGQDSCYPAPALIVLDALTVTETRDV